MQRFTDEEYHMWGDYKFCITDDDIKKLKQGKTLYGDVNDEYSVQLKYVDESEAESEAESEDKE